MSSATIMPCSPERPDFIPGKNSKFVASSLNIYSFIVTHSKIFIAVEHVPGTDLWWAPVHADPSTCYIYTFPPSLLSLDIPSPWWSPTVLSRPNWNVTSHLKLPELLQAELIAPLSVLPEELVHTFVKAPITLHYNYLRICVLSGLFSSWQEPYPAHP